MTAESPQDPRNEIARLKRRLERERAIRLEAEAIAEKGLRELYDRQREVQLQEHIASAANQMGSVRDVLQFTIEQICDFASWEMGHALIVTEGKLRSSKAWHTAHSNQTEDFWLLTEESEFGPGIGLPGRALDTGKPVWIADLARDANFPRLQAALRGGLKCACAFPVLSGTDVVAVVEFFGLHARAPNAALLDTMGQIGNQLGRAIERHQAQARLEIQAIALGVARDEARAADKAKSAFLANMSHELRTPLNAIIGFSGLMLENIFGPLADKYVEYARDINVSGVHLKDILNDILDISKIEAGAMQLHAEETSLAEIGEACRRIIAPLAKAEMVQLSFAIPASLPQLRLDRTRFKQALINVVSNAVKFTPKGGQVHVEAAMTGCECVIAITDTGIGMTAEGIALALLPFRQVDSALNRRFEGTGLGLPLAKALVELHGGRLAIESAPCAGTTVRFHLPAAGLAAAA